MAIRLQKSSKSTIPQQKLSFLLIIRKKKKGLGLKDAHFDRFLRQRIQVVPLFPWLEEKQLKDKQKRLKNYLNNFAAHFRMQEVMWKNFCSLKTLNKNCATSVAVIF